MSSEIPVYPSQPTIDIGTVEPQGAPQYDLSNDPEAQILYLSEEEVSELHWSTPSDAAQFVETCYIEDTIPTGYQYYYWYIDVPVTSDISTGIITNMMYHSGTGFNYGRLIIGPDAEETNEFTVRIWFIFHPTNRYNGYGYWYVGVSKDNDDIKFKAIVENTVSNDYYALSYSPATLPASKMYKLFMIPWNTSENGIFTPNELKLLASNKLPII